MRRSRSCRSAEPMKSSRWTRIMESLGFGGGKKTQTVTKSRGLRLEPLEERQLLAVSVYDDVINMGFENPGLSTGQYQVNPTDATWQFPGLTGITSNDSAFTINNPDAPEGTQVAFLKENCSFSQSVTLNAGTYSISFVAAQRANYQTGKQQIKVLVDGNQVDLFTRYYQ